MGGKRNKKHQKKNSQQNEEDIENKSTETDVENKLNTIVEPEISTSQPESIDSDNIIEKVDEKVEENIVNDDEKEKETLVSKDINKQEVVEKVDEKVDEKVEVETVEQEVVEKEEENEKIVEKKENDNGWGDDLDFNDLPTKTIAKSKTPKKQLKIDDDFSDEDNNNNTIEPPTQPKKKTKIIKKIIRKPVIKTKPTPPQPVQSPVQQTSGWGWFSSISTAVTSTINSITRLDEEDEEDFIEEVVEVEVTDDEEEEDNGSEIRNKKTRTDTFNHQGEEEQEDDEEHHDKTLLNAIDNGVFKTADIIADSLVFAGSFLTSGFKSVQENANIENVKGIAQGVANLSMETKKKATNSEMYEKGQKIATSMVDSSVDVLESVGNKAYSIFSTSMKNSKQANPNSNDVPSQGQTSPTLNNSQETISSPNSQPIQSSPKDKRLKSSTGSNNSMSGSTGMNRKIIQPIDIHVFDDGQFNSTTASEHFKIPEFIQTIEKLSVESTMKIHQINRKLTQQMKLQVNSDLDEIKELFENDDQENTGITKELQNKNIFFNNESFELQSDYNEYFDRLQDFLPTLKSKSSEFTLCRGLENIYQLLALSLQLLSIISQSLIDKRSSTINEDNDFIITKETTIKRLNEILFLMSKYKQDIKSISLIITEILKSKPNPNSRKLINTLNIETNSAISHVDDSKGGLLSVLQISYLNEIKLPKKSTSTPTKSIPFN